MFLKQIVLKLPLVKWLKYKVWSNMEHNGIFVFENKPILLF